MIVSASYRTDIPAFYGDWFQQRLRAGFCQVANPYGGPPVTVDLTPGAVDGFVFWTRNAAPFTAALAEVTRRAVPFVMQYTITGYPRALEPSVTDSKRSIETLRALADLYGPRVCVWRYDPVLLTSLTPPAWHRETFARLAAALAGAVDEVVLSFAHIYAKTARNTARAATRHGFSWEDSVAEVKRDLLAELAAIATGHGLRATLCAQTDLLTSDLTPARCIDAARLADVAGRPIGAKTKGNRPGCLCAESRDIGAYDSCPHGCVYCYAVRTPEAAKRTYRNHDPAAAAIVPPRVMGTDRKS
ncbi:MAG: DUF1848 domain-containing protein [Alphaproteobacteria bacterium]